MVQPPADDVNDDLWEVRTIWHQAPLGSVAIHTFNEEPFPGLGVARLHAPSGDAYPDARDQLVRNALLASLNLEVSGEIVYSDPEYPFRLQGLLDRWMDPVKPLLTRHSVENPHEAFMAMPIPEFGSPPHSWASLQTKLALGTPFVAGTGYLAAHDHPVLIFVEAGVTTIAWFLTPSAKVLRRTMAQRVAESVGTTLDPSDFK